jgi:hypothetical protein
MGAETGGSAKPSWPLLVLAACAFIPGVGFFFGSGAVSWALVTERPRRRLALFLGAGGAALNLAAIFFLMAAFSRNPELQQIYDAGARQDLVTLVTAIDEYHARHGSYPADLRQLQQASLPLRIVNIHDQARGMFHPLALYEYRRATDGGSYDLYSTGADGIPGTPDDLRPPLPDSVLARSGYRASR